MPTSKNRVAVPGTERAPVPGAEAVGAAAPDARIQVSVILRSKKSYRSIQSSGALKAVRPAERTYLSREDFEKVYGADPKDVQKVEAFAHAYNLTVMQVSLARRTVVLAGTISQVCAAFGSQLTNYKHQGRTFRGRTGGLTIPADLSGIVEGVFGLDNRCQARPHVRRRCAGSQVLRAVAPSLTYTPVQVASLYNFPTGTNGAGQCIGIIEFGGGYQQSDLQSYFGQLGIAEPAITAVSVDGVQNQPTPGTDSPDAEVDLDIEVAGAAAPGASIVVYFAEF
ncbi:MAG: S53 family peptidase, partial [Terriglobia bacterium]